MILTVEREREMEREYVETRQTTCCVTSPDSDHDPIMLCKCLCGRPLFSVHTLQRWVTKKRMGTYVDDDEGWLQIYRGEEERITIRETASSHRRYQNDNMVRFGEKPETLTAVRGICNFNIVKRRKRPENCSPGEINRVVQGGEKGSRGGGRGGRSF